MGFNKVILQGNLSEEITLRYGNNGTASAKVGIAVGKKFKKQDGSQGEKTLFVKLQFWGRSAEILNQYCRKGSKVLIEGELENNNWVDNNGNKKYDYSINVSNMQMLDTKADGQAKSHNEPSAQSNSYSHDNQNVNNSYQAPTPAYETMPKNDIPEINIDEDEIPF